MVVKKINHPLEKIKPPTFVLWDLHLLYLSESELPTSSFFCIENSLSSMLFCIPACLNRFG